jgi:Protein of unknown function (DUF3145).
MTIQRTRGVLFVHSAPKALTPHVEWAAGKALGHAVNFAWQDQPVLPGSLRTEFEWEGPVGSAAGIASALRGWEHLRFEVTEEASLGVDGGRFMHTPDLGVFISRWTPRETVSSRSNASAMPWRWARATPPRSPVSCA